MRCAALRCDAKPFEMDRGPPQVSWPALFCAVLCCAVVVAAVVVVVAAVKYSLGRRTVEQAMASLEVDEMRYRGGRIAVASHRIIVFGSTA